MLPEKPDVLDEDLTPWTPDGRLDVEDALVGDHDLAELKAPGARVLRSRFDRTRLAGARLRSIRLVDALLADADLSNADLGGGHLARVRFERCRMTGFKAAEARLEDVAFVGCKLDLASLRGATLRRVVFQDCVLDDADLTGAQLRDCRFAGSQLRHVLIDHVRLRAVDLRGSDVEPDGDVTALRGATIAPVQLVALGPLLASGLGIDVRD
jgi:uncharacterized protein YjbI with pentapeptide repeats